MRPRYPIPREDLTPLPTTIRLVEPTPKIPVIAAAQKKVANGITIAEKKLTEFEQIYNFTTDSQLRHDMHKLLLESQEIILYDKPGHPPLLFQHPDLHYHIHDSNLEEKYNVYMARTTLNNYLLPHQSNSIAARAHHHPAWIAVAGVSCAETRDHPNGHYCLASVKCAKQFATVFADMSVVISQDDKAKIGLGVPAVGGGQKLVPSVYLMIKPNESNDELRTGQLAIFVHCQWSLGTSSHTHMQDLESLTLDPQYDDLLKTNGAIRPIWVLLVDGGSDENPRHLKTLKHTVNFFENLI
ncbi:5463_t:CDS:2 [Entrophospora sp. SA101]|nr:5463_t:CDS:2 [Entrophospora sp. SA101]